MEETEENWQFLALRMAIEEKVDEVQASVLHGVKDLQIVCSSSLALS